MNIIDNRESYRRKKEQLLEQLKSAEVKSIGLNKSTSNLFRHRFHRQQKKISLNHFNRVIYLDPEKKAADVEGLATYADIVAALPLRPGARNRSGDGYSFKQR